MKDHDGKAMGNPEPYGCSCIFFKCRYDKNWIDGK